MTDVEFAAKVMRRRYAEQTGVRSAFSDLIFAPRFLLTVLDAVDDAMPATRLFAPRDAAPPPFNVDAVYDVLIAVAAANPEREGLKDARHAMRFAMKHVRLQYLKPLRLKNKTATSCPGKLRQAVPPWALMRRPKPAPVATDLDPWKVRDDGRYGGVIKTQLKRNEAVIGRKPWEDR